MNSEYRPGETLIAEIPYTFIDPLSINQIAFYSGNDFIPMVSDLGKIGDTYYLYAVLPKTQKNYTLIISNAHYYDENGEQIQDLTKEFSVKGTVIPFSVNPGFIIAGSDFNVKINANSNLVVQSKFLDSVQSTQVYTGTSSKVYFSTASIYGQVITNITFSASGVSYSVPALISVYNTPPASVCPVECTLGEVESSCFNQTSNQTRTCIQNSSGCIVWTDYTLRSCSSDNFCQQPNGNCIAAIPESSSCPTSECSPGEFNARCYNQNLSQTRICMQNATGCFIWSSWTNTSCPSGTYCNSSLGTCMQSLQFTCTIKDCTFGLTESICKNQTKSSRTCIQNSSGCIVWSSWANTTCPSGKFCDSSLGCVNESTVYSPIRFLESKLVLTLLKNKKTSFEISISNTGDTDLKDIELEVEGFSGLVKVSPSKFDLDSGELKMINVSVSSYSQNKTINGTITAYSGDFITASYITLKFVSNQSELKNPQINTGTNKTTGLTSCTGKICKSGETCSGKSSLTLEGICCSGSCSAPASETNWIAIIISVILLIGLGIFIFLKMRKKTKTPEEALKEKTSSYESRFKSKEVRGNLGKV